MNGRYIIILSLGFILTGFVSGEPTSWDISIRFDIADFNKFYPFSPVPGRIGETYYANLNESDDLFDIIPICSTGAGVNCHWARKCRSACNRETCRDDEMSACQCWDVSNCYRPRAWYAERKKVDENKYQILIRGVSQADCGKGQAYVKGKLRVNPDNGWRITHIEKCSTNRDTRGREYYCRVDNSTGEVRFAGGSSCGGCCACEDSGWLNINITVESNLTDLSIKRGDITFSNQNPSGGDLVTISARVHNTERNVSNVLVRFYSGDPERGGKRMGERRIPFMGVDSSEEAEIEWNVSKTADIYVVVDPEDEISESDEDNNEAFKRLNIEGPDYLLYFAIGVIIVTCILGVIVLFAIYRALTYKKPAKENVECPRCGMILPMGTKECPVCGNKI